MGVLNDVPVAFTDHPGPDLPDVKRYPPLRDDDPLPDNGLIDETMETLPMELKLQILSLIPSVEVVLSYLFHASCEGDAIARTALTSQFGIDTSHWTPAELNKMILWCLYDPELLKIMAVRQKAVRQAESILEKLKNACKNARC